ncbi:flagellar hook-length control protein [Mycobacteroides chelonae]|uniref:flagellar hook-length control protein n=1 Tax=Mycobacteroides chelonae TaxID=1774 RepID=UPI0018B0AEC7|nr:flagellar hook-length control protein [Mycobacteroides chelonae]MBF9328241.1 flagellar hook-length control protein [Mycobacteroides chelonae]MBF9422419.1 flagellar hook-length control protein [Mycobacteroides chelonae]
MSTMTKRDVVTAAMSVADDAAEGRLDPATLESQLVEELHELVGSVVGEDDPLWPLQLDVARGVLAAGGLDASELSEWAAVARRRENPDTEALSAPVPIGGADTPPEAISSGSGELSPENGAADDDFADLPPSVIKEAEQAAMDIVNEWREANR